MTGGVTAIAARVGHSLFLKSDGSLWGMGINHCGELGDGTTTARHTPVKIVPSGVTAVAAGMYDSLFLKSDGTLWGMGIDHDGELGDGTVTERDTPVTTSLKSNTPVAGSTFNATESVATQNRSPVPLDYQLAIPNVPENLRILAMEAVDIDCDETPWVFSARGSTRLLTDSEIKQGELINLDQEFPSEAYIVAYGYDIKINGKATRIISAPQLDRILLFSGPGTSQVVEDGTNFPDMYTLGAKNLAPSDIVDYIKLQNIPATAIRCSGTPWVVSYSKGANGHSFVESGTRPLNAEEIEQGSLLLDQEFPSGYVVCYPYHVKINGKTTYIISTPQSLRRLIFTGPGAPQVEQGDVFGVLTYPSEPGLYRH